MEFSFGVVGAVIDDLVCDVVIVTSQSPKDLLLILLSTEVLSELKMVTSSFVKSV